jgi:hypothetical protein
MNNLIWDYAPSSTLFDNLRHAPTNATAYPFPNYLRTAIHTSLVEIEHEARRLNEDIELNQWRMRFDRR